jgi:glycine/D-amino acid oxidase-like deaminating enzyme
MVRQLVADYDPRVDIPWAQLRHARGAGLTDALHTARGWWLIEAPAATPLPSLVEDLTADVVIVGGGYTGLWTAWHALERHPSAIIVVLEADVCGYGPSGRNGGFCGTLWRSLPTLRDQLGDSAALRLAHASSESVNAIEEWCRQESVDAWFRQAGTLVASTAPAQDDAGVEAAEAAAELGVPERVQFLSSAEVQARCRAPVFRGGVFLPDEATVQPARLALGLRARLLDRGVRIFEHSRVRQLEVRAGSVTATTPGGRLSAQAAVLAINAATRGFRPLRSRL